MDTLSLIVVVGLIVSVVPLVAFHVALRLEARNARKETSRFPLFAVRTMLVRLVAAHKMSENDAAWKVAYEAVNSLLSLDRKLHAIDIIVQIIRFHVAIERDPELKKYWKKIQDDAKAASQKVPEFGMLQEAMGSALLYLMYRRTTRIHRLFLHLLGWVVGLYQLGLSGARTIASTFTGRSAANNAMMWSLSRRCRQGL